MGTMKWLVIFVLMGINSQATAMTASVFASTSNMVLLQWTPVTGATSYEITVALKSSPGNRIAFATYGQYTVMGSISSLSPGILYEFTINAVGASGNVLSTAPIDSYTAPDMMDPIQDVKAKDSKTLMASFSSETDATSYIIRIQNANGFYREDTVSMSPAEIGSLTPYTEYTLSIIAVCSAGRSQPSSPVTAKTVLPPPEIISTSSPSNDSITVSWTPVAQAVQYTMSIYGPGGQRNYNTSDTSLTVSDLDAGSLYSIKCYGWDTEGRKGESSPYVNQTTLPPTPFSVNVSMEMTVTGPGLSVSWELEVNVSITYSRAQSNNNLTCTSSSTSCILSPVACGQVYTIQVTAWNEAGPSYPSSPVVFITYPCPPESLALVESEDNCTLTWDTVPYAESYEAFIKSSDSSEIVCITTGNNCTFQCLCGYTFLMSVYAVNQAGRSPQGPVLNHTNLPCCPEGVSVKSVGPDTLEIMWTPSRGAELYETRAVDSSEVILCNDTAPVCALSDLTCDSSYSVNVAPCNDRGCNRNCQAHTKDTAPCQPMDLMLHQKNVTCVTVSWTASNRAATYNVRASGPDGTRTCTTNGNSCDITNLPCGSTYEVTALAESGAGLSLPSFSQLLETVPCCPVNLTVEQVTQAITNVSWSHAKGAHLFITSLTSIHGHARCHTQDYHCLMGCITCGTNYTVTMEALSQSGRSSNCTYHGFSSSGCCPSGVRLYSRDNNIMRVYWRSGSSSRTYIAEMVGTNNNYSCIASPGENSCDIENVQCGENYNVTVAPLTTEGTRVNFCSQRQYSVTCLGTNIGTVLYRSKRSLD